MAVRAVVLDLGGVLEVVDDDRWQQAWMGRWEDATGHGRGALMAGADAGTIAAYDDGSITEAGLRAWFAQALGLSDARTEAMLADMWDGYCGVLDVELRDFVLGLRPAVATAALSNSADGARREEERRYGLSDLFDVLVYSHEVGLAKPDPAIYRLTERLLDVRPDEIVFLDDRAENVAAAQACGWHAIRHTSTDASIAAVRRRLGPAGR
ncbi:HAD family phosphatase [Patulibacter sp. NPDC049589]|uniref:HAD family hydrolase n=1 Tax=Patulibacter sp. NPDC049589 TaxID=3154731 RepID=UPI003436A59D